MGKTRSKKDIRSLILNVSTPVRIVNLITLYRIVTFPLLLVFLFMGSLEMFRWFLLASFFTDAIDGTLARRYQATSVLGARLDSIGDDLTVLAAAAGLFVFEFGFVKDVLAWLIILFAVFLIQVVSSLIRYGKISSFHTYLAKIAAVVTALFLLSVFFLEQVIHPLFYAAWIITALELIEETIIVFINADWKTNVKGLYWVLKKRR